MSSVYSKEDKLNLAQNAAMGVDFTPAVCIAHSISPAIFEEGNCKLVNVI
jgi:hypothetical protein